MTVYLKPRFGESAIVSQSKQIIRLGKWRLYRVKFIKKGAMMLVDHLIRDKYHNLHRLTDYKFIGLDRKE